MGTVYAKVAVCQEPERCGVEPDRIYVRQGCPLCRQWFLTDAGFEPAPDVQVALVKNYQDISDG